MTEDEDCSKGQVLLIIRLSRVCLKAISRLVARESLENLGYQGNVDKVTHCLQPE